MGKMLGWIIRNANTFLQIIGRIVFSLNAFRMPTWLYKLGNFFKETGTELVGRTAGSAKAAENYLLKAQEQAGKNKPLELDPLVDFNAEVAKAS